MFSKNHGALPLCTTEWYISTEEVLGIGNFGPNPLISKCENFKMLSKNFYFYGKSTKIAYSGLNPLIYPQISRCENSEMFSKNL